MEQVEPIPELGCGFHPCSPTHKLTSSSYLPCPKMTTQQVPRSRVPVLPKGTHGPLCPSLRSFVCLGLSDSSLIFRIYLRIKRFYRSPKLELELPFLSFLPSKYLSPSVSKCVSALTVSRCCNFNGFVAWAPTQGAQQVVRYLCYTAQGWMNEKKANRVTSFRTGRREKSLPFETS
jgi:hypothetical protein